MGTEAKDCDNCMHANKAYTEEPCYSCFDFCNFRERTVKEAGTMTSSDKEHPDPDVRYHIQVGHRFLADDKHVTEGELVWREWGNPFVCAFQQLGRAAMYKSDTPGSRIRVSVNGVLIPDHSPATTAQPQREKELELWWQAYNGAMSGLWSTNSPDEYLSPQTLSKLSVSIADQALADYRAKREEMGI